MSKLAIAGILLCLLGCVILGFQAIASVMGPDAVYKNTLVIDLIDHSFIDEMDQDIDEDDVETVSRIARNQQAFRYLLGEPDSLLAAMYSAGYSSRNRASSSTRKVSLSMTGSIP